MNYHYNIVCPACGNIQERYDDVKLVWRLSDGDPPSEFGQTVEYDEMILDGTAIVCTGRVLTTTLICPECGYGGDACSVPRQ